jgi:hypothetical protein
MTQYLQGVTFPNQTFTPSEWGQMFEAILPNGILRGCAMTSSGTSFNIAKGAILLKGRLIVIPSTVTESTSPTYPDGYGRVKLCINTSNTSTSLVNQQAYITTEYSSSSTFPSLTQQDVNDGGTTYEVALATLKYSGGSISTVTANLGRPLTASKLVKTDSSGKLTASTVNESYLTGITSDVQTQLNAKQKAITYGTSDPSGGSNGDIYIKYTN